MESQGTYQAGSTTADDATPEKVVQIEDRQRKARVADALRTGERLPSADMRDGEYYTVTHRALLAVLATTRQLTANEYQYLFALLAHTNGKCPWAIIEYPNTPPNLPDWCNWLGGMAAQQVCNVRASLRDKGIITFIDNDPLKVCLVSAWEQWNAAVFEPHARKQGAGRKPTRQTEETPDAHSKLSNLEGENLNQVINPAKLSNLESKLPNLEPLIKQFKASEPEAGNHQAREGALNKGNKNRNKKEEDQTDAHASGHGVDTPASDTPPSSPEKKASKPRKERGLSLDHQYRVDLIAAVSNVRGCASPNKNAEWGAAGKYFRWNGDTSAPIDDVVTCFTIEQRAPHWDTNTLTLNDLIKPYGAYLRSGLTAFENAIKRKRDAANGEYDKPRQNGRTTVADIPNTIARLGANR